MAATKSMLVAVKAEVRWGDHHDARLPLGRILSIKPLPDDAGNLKSVAVETMDVEGTRRLGPGATFSLSVTYSGAGEPFEKTFSGLDLKFNELTIESRKAPVATLIFVPKGK